MALGRAWQHYDPNEGRLQFPRCDGRPILAGYEQLMSLKCACEIAELSRDQIEGIFWRNAVTAFGIGTDEALRNGHKSASARLSMRLEHPADALR